VKEVGYFLLAKEKLTTEAPVNGGRNYNDPKVNLASLSQTKLYAGNSSLPNSEFGDTALPYSSDYQNLCFIIIKHNNEQKSTS
jgi:hypothetical protein